MLGTSENNCFLYDADGKHRIVEGDEAIKIWVYKALNTERFRYLAYSWQYGIELRPFIGKVMGVQQRYSEIKRVIVECLMVNPYIKSIDTIDIKHEGDTVNISIMLTTIYGEVNVMYEARKQSDILTELQQNAGSDTSSYEGTFTYDVLAANSIEFSKEEVELEQAYKAAFARSSWGEYLEMRAEEHGIFRKNAIKAVGTVTVSGNGIIPLGSIFQTETGISFQATKVVTVSKSGDVPVECTAAGIVGNVAAKTVTKIPMSIPGISSVINDAAMHDGFNEEDDDSLFNRLLFKVRQPATSGNKNEYLQWATSVAGVGKAIVLPLWNGNGTVKVLITDTNGTPRPAICRTKFYHTLKAFGLLVRQLLWQHQLSLTSKWLSSA